VAAEKTLKKNFPTKSTRVWNKWKLTSNQNLKKAVEELNCPRFEAEREGFLREELQNAFQKLKKEKFPFIQYG